MNMIQFELNLVLKDEISYDQKKEVKRATAIILHVPGRDIEMEIIEIENKQKKNDTASLLTFVVKSKIHSLNYVATNKVIKTLNSEKFYSDLKEALLKNKEFKKHLVKITKSMLPIVTRIAGLFDLHLPNYYYRKNFNIRNNLW